MTGMISLAALAFLLSLVLTLILRRCLRRWSVRYPEDAPQRFHVGEVPRVGGLALVLAWFLVLLILPALQWVGLAGNIDFERLAPWTWMLLILPALLGATAEDFTQCVGVRWRLVLTLISALLAWWLFDIRVPRLGFAFLDAWWSDWLLPGTVLAVLAVTGLPHAFNIIDGYNGLSGMMALVVCLALGHVAIQVGDRELATVAVVLAAATAGFLAWNYPLGLVFAGDAGAYVWGVMVAVVSILLVQRHDAVSPWFPMLLLIYPVWETLFSMYRKWWRGDSPGMADALHLHQLVYRRVVRSVMRADEAESMLKRNNRTAPYLWGFIALTVTPALIFWRYSGILLIFCLLFAVTYVSAYLMVVRFKLPRFLQGSSRK